MDTNSILEILRKTLPSVLSFELFLGGQARITSLLTPTLYAQEMSKAEGTRDAFYLIIPIKDATRHSNFIGVLMCIAGFLVMQEGTRVPYGASLTLMLTSTGIYSQRRMRISYWVPVANTALVGTMLALEKREVASM